MQSETTDQQIRIPYAITVVGMKYLGKSVDDVSSHITFRPEPDNQYDADAMAVHSDSDNEKLGYVSKDCTAIVKYLLSLNTQLEV